ncbi:MAG: hypothetical protein LBB75_07595, partial [Oscillospiraceae bacterium]|nr:hypothetical protein [Oscillospiraceae bacterium]
FQALRGNLQRIVAANGSLLRYVLDAAKYILWPMKNPLVLTIASKGGSQGPIHIKLPKRIGQIDISADVAPLPDTAAITREIGTIINDIQKAGFSAAAGSPPAPVRQAPQYPAQQAWYAGGYQQPDPYYPQAQPYGQANGGYQPYIA